MEVIHDADLKSSLKPTSNGDGCFNGGRSRVSNIDKRSTGANIECAINKRRRTEEHALTISVIEIDIAKHPHKIRVL